MNSTKIEWSDIISNKISAAITNQDFTQHLKAFIQPLAPVKEKQQLLINAINVQLQKLQATVADTDNYVSSFVKENTYR